jgi:invasion protein IalB
MANSLSHFVTGGRVAGAAAALMLVLTGWLTIADAQTQTPAKKGQDKAAPKAAPKAAAKGGDGAQSAWVKLCEKATAVTKDKDGKEDKKDLNICLTHHERLDGNSGMILVSAALRQIDNQEKQHFMVMVPLGMMLQPGMRATLFPKEMWEKVQKNEQVDDSKLKAVRLTYTLCHPAGCTAEIETTPEFLNDLKTNGGLLVFAINAVGQPVVFPVPLQGFTQANSGGPVDAKTYSEARRQLMMQIAQRQQQMAEEYKKKNDELQKMQGAEAHKGGPPAAKGAAPPPAQKK